MSAPCLISSSWPSSCQKLSNLVNIWQSYDKNNFDFFFWGWDVKPYTLNSMCRYVGLPLDSAAKKQLVLIATCHVHWDPEYCDVKLIQTMMFMHRLQNIVKEAQAATVLPPSSSSDCNQVPVILCGDLNSLPESGIQFNALYLADRT